MGWLTCASSSSGEFMISMGVPFVLSPSQSYELSDLIGLNLFFLFAVTGIGLFLFHSSRNSK